MAELGRRWWSMLAVALLGCGSAKVGQRPEAAPKPAESRRACEPFELRFAPGDLLRFTHRIETVKQKSVDDGPPVTETIRLEEEVELRRSATGYVMTTTPKPAALSRSDGRRVGAIAHVPLETPLTYELDPQGRALSVKGFEGIAERLRAAAISDEERAAAPALTPQLLAAAKISEWSGQVADLVGQKGCVGDDFEAESDFQLPTGPIHFSTALRMTGFVECSLGKCLVIDRVYDSESSAVEAWLKTAVFKQTRHDVSKSFITGTAQSILDPTTMRHTELTMTRTVAFTLASLNGRQRLSMTERQGRTFEYHPL